MNINNLLLDLEVIRQINENDKLSVCLLPGSTRLIVDSNTFLTPITRWYNNYSRETTIEYLDTFINNINEATVTITGGNHKNLANTLKEAIKHAIPGLENLKKTYSQDSVISSKIVLFINRLNEIVISINTFLGENMTINETNLTNNLSTLNQYSKKKSSSTRDNELNQ